jgi:hypothetical protein
MRVSFPSRVIGILLMVVTIGLASCQALFLGPPEAAQTAGQLPVPAADGQAPDGLVDED